MAINQYTRETLTQIGSLAASERKEVLEWLLTITPSFIKKMMATDVLLLVMKLQYLTKTMAGIRMGTEVLIALEERCQKLSFEKGAQYWLRDGVETIRKNSSASVEKFGKRMELHWGHINKYLGMKKLIDDSGSVGECAFKTTIDFYDKLLDLENSRKLLCKRTVLLVDLEISDKADKIRQFFNEYFVDTSGVICTKPTAHDLSTARMFRWLDEIEKGYPADGLLKKITYIHEGKTIETELTDLDSYCFIGQDIRSSYFSGPMFTLIVPDTDHIPYFDIKEKQC